MHSDFDQGRTLRGLVLLAAPASVRHVRCSLVKCCCRKDGREDSSSCRSNTTDELGDLVLDFGVDSMPACSSFLRAASPVFNRMLQSGMQESQQGTVKVEVAKKEEFAIFYSLLWPGEWSRDKVTEANVDSLLLPDGLHAACLRGTAAHPPGDRWRGIVN